MCACVRHNAWQTRRYVMEPYLEQLVLPGNAFEERLEFPPVNDQEGGAQLRGEVGKGVAHQIMANMAATITATAIVTGLTMRLKYSTVK